MVDYLRLTMTVGVQGNRCALAVGSFMVCFMPSSLHRKTAEEELRARTIELATDFAKFHHAQGKEEGKAEGEAKSILAVLAARRIPVTSDQRTAIERCTDLRQLDEWLRRAATAESTDEVFA
jgi:hypothetical protein